MNPAKHIIPFLPTRPPRPWRTRRLQQRRAVAGIGTSPVFDEDDVFRLIAPLDDEYSADRAFEGELPQIRPPQESVLKDPEVNEKVNERQRQIIAFISSDPHITQIELASKLEISVVHVDKNMKKLQRLGIIRRVGPDKGGHWEVIG